MVLLLYKKTQLCLILPLYRTIKCKKHTQTPLSLSFDQERHRRRTQEGGGADDLSAQQRAQQYDQEQTTKFGSIEREVNKKGGASGDAKIDRTSNLGGARAEKIDRTINLGGAAGPSNKPS